MGYDRMGSLTLKSQFPMDYGRGVLTKQWHQSREAEPMDHPLWSGDSKKPNLHQSTYKQLSKDIKSDVVSSETETRCRHEETLRLKEFGLANQDPHRQMVDESNQHRLNKALSAYAPSHPKNDVTPTHAKGHDKHHFETTYNKDYELHHPELVHLKSTKAQRAEFQAATDNSFAFRRQQSQFSDIDGPKRTGINTFHVQHGEYPNQKMKHELNARSASQIFF